MRMDDEELQDRWSSSDYERQNRESKLWWQDASVSANHSEVPYFLAFVVIFRWLRYNSAALLTFCCSKSLASEAVLGKFCQQIRLLLLRCSSLWRLEQC